MPDPITVRPVDGGVEIDLPGGLTQYLTWEQAGDLIDALDAARGAA